MLVAVILLTSLQPGCTILFDRADEPRQAGDAGVADSASNAPDAAPGAPDADRSVTLGPVETLSDGTAHASFSSVIFDGSDFRVVWADNRDATGGEVYAMTLGSSGPVRITTTGGTKPSSVWHGNNLAIAWVDARTNPDSIYAGLYDVNNQLVGTETFVSEDLDGTALGPSLAATGTQLGVAWFELELNQQIAFARLDGTGALVAPAQLIQMQAAVPAIAFNGDSYGLTWHGTSDRNIFFRSILPTGVTSGSVTDLTSTNTDSLLPAVASDGLSYAVVYQEGPTDAASLFFVSVSATAQGGTPVEITGLEAIPSFPAIAWSGDAYGIVWQDARSGRSEIYFREFDSSGTPIGDEVQISNGLSGSVVPSLVHSGSEYGASWQMGLVGTQVIQFRTIAP